MIDQELKHLIRVVQDFPKNGISYKDITPLFLNVEMSNRIIDCFAQNLSNIKVDAIAGIESRGFIFGMALANRLKVPFIPIRKKGKLPYETISQDYDLEYGNATIEIHTDAIKKGWNVVVHDDLLATGGTASAAAKLINNLEANVCAFAFIVELSFLNGNRALLDHSDAIISLTKYKS
jgi:adenine phosphoribosyltransferase